MSSRAAAEQRIVRLKLTGSAFVAAAGAAFRIKGEQAQVTGNHFRTPAGGALHADGSGVLRVKDSRFTSDTDGVVVGAQH